jgi:hypothetical protein
MEGEKQKWLARKSGQDIIANLKCHFKFAIT